MSEQLPLPETVAVKLAHTVATDFVLQSVFGEHRGQHGDNFRLYTEVSESSTQDDVMSYTGFTVGNSTKRPRTADKWGVPFVDTIWSAQPCTVNLRIGDTVDPGVNMVNSNRGGAGYFWQDDNGKWQTDDRKVGEPAMLGLLAQELTARQKLIHMVRLAGPTAVKDYVRIIPGFIVDVRSRNQKTLTASFDADHIFDILTQHKRNEPAMVRYTWGEVVETLMTEENLGTPR